MTIADALRSAQPSARIEVRPGLYVESLVVETPVQIIGVGSRTAVVIAATDGPCLRLNTEETFVQGLVLRARSEQTGDVHPAVDISQGRLTLENCHLAADGGACIAVHGAGAEGIVRHCMIHDGGSCGVRFWDGGRGTIEDCHVFGNAGPGIAIGRDSSPTITGCAIYNGGGNGIAIHDRGHGTVDGCDIFANAQAGIWIGPGGNVAVRRCTIHENPAGSVYCYGRAQGMIEIEDLREHWLRGGDRARCEADYQAVYNEPLELVRPLRPGGWRWARGRVRHRQQ